MSTITVDDVAQVLHDYPGLTPYGFRDGWPSVFPNEGFMRDVLRVHRWIRETPRASALIARRGSYALKGIAERDMHTFIPNGALITAAILAGFRPHQTRPGPNCRFTK